MRGTARLIVAHLALTVALMSGCASDSRPLEIRVTGDTFNVGQRLSRSPAELAEAIRASGATECRVLPSPESTYEQVASAMKAVQDAGCWPRITGNVVR